MKTKTTTFKGLTFDILVEEAQQRDPQGGHLWYLAAVYVRDRSGAKTLVRKSRLPGAADELAALVRRDGLRVFDRLSRKGAAAAGAQPARATRPGQLPQPQRGGTQQQPAPSSHR